MNFVSKLRAEALAARLLPALSSGLVSVVYIVIYVFSAGGIIFSGALAPFFSQGTGTVLYRRAREERVGYRQIGSDYLDGSPDGVEIHRPYFDSLKSPRFSSLAQFYAALATTREMGSRTMGSATNGKRASGSPGAS